MEIEPSSLDLARLRLGRTIEALQHPLRRLTVELQDDGLVQTLSGGKRDQLRQQILLIEAIVHEGAELMDQLAARLGVGVLLREKDISPLATALRGKNLGRI